MVDEVDDTAALAGRFFATDFVAVWDVGVAADVALGGAWDAGGGVVCANARVTQENKKIEEMKCFIVRGFSGVILMECNREGGVPMRVLAGLQRTMRAFMRLYAISR